ncbi:MAG: argininosuccinate synthase [Candidatus Omnitrophica bacterium]|nr:argininosuccinate synthase [Candidatus Omnitrophota bacterium]
MAKKKVILAYSGGLDTSCCIKWLKDTCNLDVVCFSAFIGEASDKAVLRKRAYSAGASKVYIEDLKKEFADDFILPSLWAHANYEGKYLLATAIGRPLIAKHLVSIAHKEKAQFVAHGCTGKGNDQVRIEVGVRSLAPKLKIIAPLREWEFSSREEEIDYAKRNKIKIDVTKKSPYSIDRNIWGAAIEAGILEDPWREPPEDAYYLTKGKVPTKSRYVEVTFIHGTPVALNGKKMNLVSLIEKLNKITGQYKIGRTDVIENRLVGIKSREIYEAPAATVLMAAHAELESLVFDREFVHFKDVLSLKYSELIYYGLWYSPLKEALDSFFVKQQHLVTGTVKVKLSEKCAQVVGRKSPYSLYREKLATYSHDDQFNHEASKGFIELWGLPYVVATQVGKKSMARKKR